MRQSATSVDAEEPGVEYKSGAAQRGFQLLRNALVDCRASASAPAWAANDHGFWGRNIAASTRPSVKRIPQSYALAQTKRSRF
jgi:hypothetical protein